MEQTILPIEELNNAISRVEARLQELQKQIEPLLDERQRLQTMRDRLTELISLESGVSRGEESAMAAEMRSVPLRGASLTDAARQVILDYSKPLHYTSIAQELMGNGQELSGSNPTANLVTALSRDPRFVRTGRGVYGLVELAHRAAKQPRRAERRRVQ